ncbi:hypothetical protein [Streptomyces capitiformicae]|nr:hypothetical protein [Streptomyces capitiformicae]
MTFRPRGTADLHYLVGTYRATDTPATCEDPGTATPGSEDR